MCVCAYVHVCVCVCACVSRCVLVQVCMHVHVCRDNGNVIIVWGFLNSLPKRQVPIPYFTFKSRFCIKIWYCNIKGIELWEREEVQMVGERWV